MKIKTGNQNMFYNNSKTLGCTSNAELSASESIKPYLHLVFLKMKAAQVKKPFFQLLESEDRIGKSCFQE